MNPAKMERCLQSTGKKAFILCFWPLRGYALGNVSKIGCAAALSKQGLGSTHRRITSAEQIFKAGMEVGAIESVLRSRRADVALVHGKARRILSQLRVQQQCTKD